MLILYTGVFLDNAQELVKRPDPTPKMLKKRFTATVKDALAMGLTSVHDAGFNPVSLEFFHQSAILHVWKNIKS